MAQIGRRGIARAFLKISNSQKSQNFNFKILVRHFLRLRLLCIVKKFDSIRTKLTQEIHFEVRHSGNLPSIVACSGSTGGV